MGSATYLISTGYSVYYEIQAGGAVFTDHAHLTWGDPTLPVLYVRCSITSRPAKKRIVTDAGFKTVPGWAINPMPLINPEIGSVTMSSEHGVITLKKGDSSLLVGDTFDYQVGYGDATVFLHDKLYGCRKGFNEKFGIFKVEGKLVKTKLNLWIIIILKLIINYIKIIYRIIFSRCGNVYDKKVLNF